MIKILIADDHPIFRIGLKNMIEKNANMTVTDEASNGDEALNKALNNDFDVVLLDISMPGEDGMRVLKKLKQKKPKLPVMILSMHPEKQFAMQALRWGAAGYLTKESAPKELIAAIKEVSQGRKYITQSLGKVLTHYLQKGIYGYPHEILSEREYQVMTMICSGKSLTEIATKLSLSLSTVSTYRQRILKKMKMHNDVELSRYAVENKLII
jgi:DNA-binding NarL/FixJ family response regulator